MVYTKDGLTRKQLAELLEFSLDQRCQYVCGSYGYDADVEKVELGKKFQPRSVISFFSIKEELKRIEEGDKITPIFIFSVKVLVEDKFWEKTESHYCKSGQIPLEIHQKVVEILNG